MSFLNLSYVEESQKEKFWRLVKRIQRLPVDQLTHEELLERRGDFHCHPGGYLTARKTNGRNGEG